MTDWKKIKTEYIAGEMSQKDLAAAHGVAYSTLRDRANKEQWAAHREESRKKSGNKIAEAVSEVKIKKIEELVDKLLRQSLTAARQNTYRPITVREQTVDEETGAVTVRVRTEFERTKQVDKQGLRLLAQTAKDLCELVDRLDGGNEEKNAVTVRFEGANGDWSV